ncbi:MAG: glycosyltransferase, partial [Solirubrobacterales bacterium]|nr:glycosyltransferase [Solirubrobacterales bacterium]
MAGFPGPAQSPGRPELAAPPARAPAAGSRPDAHGPQPGDVGGAPGRRCPLGAGASADPGRAAAKPRARAVLRGLHAGPEGQGPPVALRGLGAGGAARRTAADRRPRAGSRRRLPGPTRDHPATHRGAGGHAAQPAFRDLLARARVFVSAAEWEDFGIAPLEALDRGAALVCAPAGGPFPALALGRSLAPEFVAAERSAASLARALQIAFATPDDRLSAYRVAARA